jgi:hypothetical protein
MRLLTCWRRLKLEGSKPKLGNEDQLHPVDLFLFYGRLEGRRMQYVSLAQPSILLVHD